MSWEQFCELSNIGPKYRESTIYGNEVMEKSIREKGELWLENPKKSLILTGETGRGKTYFMFCLIRELLKKRRISDLRWWKSKILDDKILEQFKEYGSSSYFLKTIKEISFLFLDDFGMERPTERAERDYYEIIDGRQEWDRPTVISTNLNASEMQKVYGKRIHSRFKEYVWITFDGNDLREII